MTTPVADVLIAHPARLFNEALTASLGEAGVATVSSAEDLAAARTILSTGPVRLALVSTELTPDGVAAMVTDFLNCGAESVVVLAPDIHENELISALEAGALGYVSRQESLERLVFDVLGALSGQACLPRDKLAPVLRLLIDRKRDEDQRAERLRRLSRREQEVLDRLAAGSSNEEMAAALYLSKATVRTHVQNILTKLEVHSRLEAIAFVHGHESPQHAEEPTR